MSIGEMMRRVMDGKATDRDQWILTVGFLCGLSRRIKEAQKLDDHAKLLAVLDEIRYDADQMIKMQLAKLPEITSPLASFWKDMP